MSFALAYDLLNEIIYARRCRLPLEINMTLRDSIQVICTISAHYVRHEQSCTIIYLSKILGIARFQAVYLKWLITMQFLFTEL